MHALTALLAFLGAYLLLRDHHRPYRLETWFRRRALRRRLAAYRPEVAATLDPAVVVAATSGRVVRWRLGHGATLCPEIYPSDADAEARPVLADKED